MIGAHYKVDNDHDEPLGGSGFGKSNLEGRTGSKASDFMPAL